MVVFNSANAFCTAAMAALIPSAAPRIPMAVATATIAACASGDFWMTWETAVMTSDTFFTASEMTGVKVLPTAIVKLFVAWLQESPIVVTPSAVLCMAPSLSSRTFVQSSMAKLPFWMLVASSWAAFLPKTSSTVFPVSPTSFCRASDTLPDSSMALMAAWKAPGTSSVSPDRLAMALVRPLMTVPTLAPPSESPISMARASSVLYPSSWNCVLFVVRYPVRSSTESWQDWLAVVRSSIRPSTSSISSPHRCMTSARESTAFPPSLPVAFAKSATFTVRSSASFPVTPKRVFSSARTLDTLVIS